MTCSAQKSRISMVPFLVSFAVLTTLALFWFLPFDFHAIMGDDLAAIVTSQHGGFGSSFVDAFTHAPANKYRPFFDMAFRVETLMLGNDLRNYIYLNIGVEIINACLLYFICWRVSGRRWPVALMCGSLFIISRFSYYNILQIFGTCLEGQCLFLVLTMVCLVVLAYQEKVAGYLIGAAAIFVWLTFTHERFLAAAPFLLLAVWWAPVCFRRCYQKYLLLAAPFAVFVCNVLIKKLILKVRFLEGTSGVEIAFNPMQVLRLFFAGVVNMLGFNTGPDYLSGIHVLDAGPYGIAVGSVFSVIILVAAVLAVKNRAEFLTNRCVPLKLLVLQAVLVLSLIAVASITIRQEYRWLYAPYAVFLVMLSGVFGVVNAKGWRLALVISLVISALSVELFYRQFLGRFYLVAALITADTAKTVIVDEGILKHPDRQVYFFKARDSEKWAFQGDDFFKYYSGNDTAHITMITDPNQIPHEPLARGQLAIYKLGPQRQVIDMTEDAKAYFGLR